VLLVVGRVVRAAPLEEQDGHVTPAMAERLAFVV
jgi:hypothetical protein